MFLVTNENMDSVYIWSSLTWIASFKSCQILSTNFSSIVIGNARILILPSFFGMVFFIMVKPPDCLFISQKNSHKNVHFNLVVHSPLTNFILSCSAGKIGKFVFLKIHQKQFYFGPFSIGGRISSIQVVGTYLVFWLFSIHIVWVI